MASPEERIKAMRVTFCLISLALTLPVAAQINRSAPHAAQPMTRVLLSFSRLRYEQLQYDLLVLQQRGAELQLERGTPSIHTEAQLQDEEKKPSTGPEAEIRSNMLKRQRQMFDESNAISEEEHDVENEMSTLGHRIDELEALLKRQSNSR